MAIPVIASGSGLGRFAKSSDDYVREIVAAQKRLGSNKLSSNQKKLRLRSILADKKNGVRRLGQTMIGPIQLKLRYEGIVRNVLMEDPQTPGVPCEYDVLNELGQAYILAGSEGEIKISPFEGKRLPVTYFRIASYPEIRKEDLYYLKSNMVEYVQNEAKEAIQKQEDARVLTLLEAAVQDWATKDPLITAPGSDYTNHVTFSGAHLTPDVFYDAAGQVDSHQLEPRKIVGNPRLLRDLYRWDPTQIGWTMKDEVVAGQTITHFGEFQVVKSIMVPNDTLYLLPEAEFLGAMPVLYSLDVVENPAVVSDFRVGFVLDEMISMAILNPRGIVKITKS